MQGTRRTSPSREPENPAQSFDDEKTDGVCDAGEQGESEDGEDADEEGPEGGEEVETELGGRAGVVVEDWGGGN